MLDDLYNTYIGPALIPQSKQSIKPRRGRVRSLRVTALNAEPLLVTHNLAGEAIVVNVSPAKRMKR